jgi:hypothetical protein
VTTITEEEFARLVHGIAGDRESIIRHNPIGTPDEILLWMLLSCLISYLNLTDLETPCFNGKPDADTYLNAIRFVLADRRAMPFDVDKYLDDLVSAASA